jgi:hypothetical protein
VENSATGIAIGNNVRLMINRSVVAGTSHSGILAAVTTAPVEVNIRNSVVSNNATGVQNGGGGGGVTIRLANNDITFNGTGLSGATQSFGNNRIQGNTALGTTPNPIGLQ